MLTGAARHDRQKRFKASYHASPLPGLECCTVVNEGVPGTFLHDRRTIMAVVAGEALVWCRGGRHLLEPGMVLLLEPGDVYRDLTPASYRALSVALTAEPLARTEAVDAPRLSRVVAQTADLASTTVALAQAICESDELATQQALATELLEALAPYWAWGAPREEPPLVARARRALLEAPLRPTSLKELAGRLRCTASYLCRVFSEHVGLGPHAYQLQLRLLAAARLLASGESVARSASRCGFSSASHLRRHFQRRFGVAPGNYVLQRVPTARTVRRNQLDVRQ